MIASRKRRRKEIGSLGLTCLVQFSSVAQSYLTLCDPMNCSTLGFPVHHQLLELTQTHPPTISSSVVPFPPAFNLSQHQSRFNESALPIRWPKYWSFNFSISPSNKYSGLISFSMTGWISLQSKRLSRVFSNTTVQKHQFFAAWLSL